MTTTKNNLDSATQMSFWDHLGELRSRLIRSLIALVLGFIIAYAFAKPLFQILTVPYNEAYEAIFDESPKLIFTGLIESFIVYLKVGLLGGLFLASPFIFYQVWAFIAPGLRASERKHVVPFVSLATLFFLGGACFGYFIVFPLGFQYFLNVAAGEAIEPLIRMREYFQLASWMMIVFGLVFEIPMLILYLAFLGLITPKQLIRPWRGVLVGIFVGSALLTPADPGSMIMMAIPMVVLYGVTILFSFIFSREKKAKPF